MSQGQKAETTADLASGVQDIASEHARKRRRDFDPDLEMLIGCCDAAHGARGTLGGIIAQIERGSVGGVRLDGSGSYIHPYTDQQLGYGLTMNGEVELYRWLATVWHAISEDSRGVLMGRYMPIPAQFRSDEGYGAPDKYVKEADPYGPAPVREIGKRGKQVRVKQFEARTARWEAQRDRVRGAARTTGVEAMLGKMAGLAIRLSETPAALLVACHDPDPQMTRKGVILVNRSLQKKRRLLIHKDIARAEEANLVAHAEWFESKAGADPRRKNSERVNRFSAGAPGL